MQFQTFTDDPMYKEQHGLHIELIRTFARVGPNTEPKFRDECKFNLTGAQVHKNKLNVLSIYSEIVP